MALPTVVTPPTGGGFTLTLDDDTTYIVPVAFTPLTLTPGQPADEVGRAPSATTWIRYGPTGRNPEPLRFRGRLWGSDAHTQLDTLQAAAKAAVTLTYDGPAEATWVYLSTGFWVEVAAGRPVTVDGGDANARETRRNDFAVTLLLFPTAPVGLE